MTDRQWAATSARPRSPLPNESGWEETTHWDTNCFLRSGQHRLTPHRGVRRHIRRAGALPPHGSRLEKLTRAGRPEAVWSDSKRLRGAPATLLPPQDCGGTVRPGSHDSRRRAVVTSYHIQRSPQFQALFHSLCRVLCTIRSLYFCTIGSASHIQAGQASSCQIHAALSSNTTQGSGAGRSVREPQSSSRPVRGSHPVTPHTLPSRDCGFEAHRTSCFCAVPCADMPQHLRSRPRTAGGSGEAKIEAASVAPTKTITVVFASSAE